MAFQPVAFQTNFQQVISTSGGGISRRKPRRYFVQVEGQDFEVSGPDEARELLQKAVALAERAAEKQVAKVQAKPSTKVAPVSVPVPQIATNVQIDLEPYRRAIEQAYRNAAVAAELRMLLEAQARDDDESAAYLLLH